MANFQKIKQNVGVYDIKVSSGQNTLDYILGGGIPLGSSVMIEEDLYKTHSRILTKHFLAEGIYQKNPLLIVSLDRDPHKMLKSLPQLVEDTKRDSNINNPDDMKIAWRYNALPQFDSSIQNTNQKYFFDLSKKIDNSLINSTDIYIWKHDTNLSKFNSVLKFINDIVKNPRFSINNSSISNTNCLRILLHSIGSPFWYESNEYKKNFLKFLTVLKCLLKYSTVVCMITMPKFLLNGTVFEKGEYSQIENLVDFIIELKSISSYDETNSYFKDYSGFLNLRKLSAINALANSYNGSYDLGYKISSRRFTIETIHLPPDIQEEESPTSVQPNLSCAGDKKHLLEF